MGQGPVHSWEVVWRKSLIWRWRDGLWGFLGVGPFASPVLWRVPTGGVRDILGVGCRFLELPLIVEVAYLTSSSGKSSHSGLSVCSVRV